MKSAAILVLPLAILAACSPREAQQKASNAATNVAQKVQDAFGDVAVPIGKREDPKQIERERFDERWRQLQSFRAQQLEQQRQAQLQQQQQPQPLNIQFATGKKESFKGLDANGINAAPVTVPIKGDISGPSVLKTQVYLDRANFSVGVLDGRWGKNSAIALWWFQRTQNLPTTGDVDEATFRALAGVTGAPAVVVPHQLTADDVKGPFVAIPEDVYEKAKLDCLCYESLKEKLAEEFHTTTDFLDLLNPDVKFADLQAGQTINVPNVRQGLTADRPDIARVVVSIAGNTFNGFDSGGRLVFHAPTTLGAGYDPSPNETLHVVGIAHNPDFHYQPKLFHEVPDSDPETMLKPGPNSPVGVVWIALSKEHYGIHGTSDPDSIGYASSHGCVRLTNWDAEDVSHRIAKGVQVEFIDTRKETGE